MGQKPFAPGSTNQRQSPHPGIAPGLASAAAWPPI